MGTRPYGVTKVVTSRNKIQPAPLQYGCSIAMAETLNSTFNGAENKLGQ